MPICHCPAALNTLARIETGAGDKALLAFAGMSLGDDAQAIAAARQLVLEELGEASMIDAAGIVANFQRMVRIADGTGIHLDGPVAALTADLREDLGINNYGAAQLTPWPGPFAPTPVAPGPRATWVAHTVSFASKSLLRNA